jgi:hypothetical protein
VTAQVDGSRLGHEFLPGFVRPRHEQNEHGDPIRSSFALVFNILSASSTYYH